MKFNIKKHKYIIIIIRELHKLFDDLVMWEVRKSREWKISIILPVYWKNMGDVTKR